MFQKLDLLLPPGEGKETITLLGPLESANHSDNGQVQKSSDSDCYTALSKPFTFLTDLM
jgi:hypothetical protein